MQRNSDFKAQVKLAADGIQQSVVKGELLDSASGGTLLANAIALIAEKAAHYDDLTTVLREFLRQRNYWVAEQNKGNWVVLHMALADNHPQKGSYLGEPIYFQTEAEAYRRALQCVAPYDAEIDSYAK